MAYFGDMAPGKTTIWVDADTGTWGTNPDGLYLLEVGSSFLDRFDEMTDSERNAHARQCGEQVKRLLAEGHNG